MSNDIKTYRCCVYQHNITGKFSAQCIPLEGNANPVCPDKPNHTIVIGFTSSNENTCEGCKELARLANSLLDDN